MAAEPSHPWQPPEITDLCEAIASLRSPEEVGVYLRDLCTLSELEAMAPRWQVVRLLEEGLPYLEISKRTHASTTTVTRVAFWLRHGEGGYRLGVHRAEGGPPDRGRSAV